MKTKILIEEVLRWRLARAEADAPPAPHARRLLEMARPWWETWPERFQSLVERVGRIQIAYGHAMAEPGQARGKPHPVPALVVRVGVESETFAQVLYLNVRDGRLRLRFHLDAAAQPTPESFEVTFISDKSASPILSAQATLSVDSEYRIDMELPVEFALDWESLKVTDRMPFRLILRTDKDAS
jgi:hypothetical protein